MTYDEFMESLSDNERIEFELKGNLVLDGIHYELVPINEKNQLEKMLGIEIICAFKADKTNLLILHK